MDHNPLRCAFVLDSLLLRDYYIRRSPPPPHDYYIRCISHAVPPLSCFVLLVWCLMALVFAEVDLPLETVLHRYSDPQDRDPGFVLVVEIELVP